MTVTIPARQLSHLDLGKVIRFKDWRDAMREGVLRIFELNAETKVRVVVWIQPGDRHREAHLNQDTLVEVERDEVPPINYNPAHMAAYLHADLEIAQALEQLGPTFRDQLLVPGGLAEQLLAVMVAHKQAVLTAYQQELQLEVLRLRDQAAAMTEDEVHAVGGQQLASAIWRRYADTSTVLAEIFAAPADKEG